MLNGMDFLYVLKNNLCTVWREDKEMNDIRNKRLLVLGATPASIDIVQQAKEMGAYTIITDWTPDAPAKAFADKAYDISTGDIDRVVEMAKREKVDGVLAGFDDFNTAIACEVSEKLGTHFYSTLYQQQALSNKKSMKELCRKFDIRSAQEYELSDLSAIEEAETLPYPVIIKPADSYGSKGIFVCQDEKDLREFFPKSLEFSKTKTVLIEEYLTGVNVNLFFTVQNGIISLSAITDKYIRKVDKKLPPQPVAHIFPSKYIEQYYSKLHNKIVKMFESLNLSNGTVDVLTFFTKGDFYIVDIGYRLCGAREYHIISHENKINSLKMYIRHSLTGDFSGWDVRKYDNPYFKKKYCMLTVLLKDGTISEIKGIDLIEKLPYVFNIIQYYKIGDKVAAQGRLQQAFARIYFEAESFEELKARIDVIQDMLGVIGSNKENMLIDGFDSAIIEQEYIK